jgi:(2S)-methylsuccinyl-CoA dehydrogenase
MPPTPTLSDARTLLEAAERLLDQAVERASVVTEGGKRIDDHQVLAERVAYAVTEGRAARAALDFAAALGEEGRSSELIEATYAASVADLVESLRVRLAPAVDDLGIGEEALEDAFPAELRALLRRANHESVYRAIGQHVVSTRGRNDLPLDEMSEQIRESVREFADAEVAPQAEHIHRTDALIPEALIGKMSELGYFGMGVPEQYGGSEMGNLAMILTTEELSRVSLAGAGSLITRPEILTKALLGGGTDEQKQQWLPGIASGEFMVGIAVTEPDVGSDVAAVKCKAVLALLARTDPDVSKGARGLSLFIVPKDAFTGHDFDMTQPGGGRMVGKADATPGYRGMHSFTLNLEDYWVPSDCLVGGEAQLGRGFYLQMAGFAAGRLQTGGRACGLAQGALEKTVEYVVDRKQFSKPLSDFQLTQYALGRMAAQLAGARAITYAAAVEMDEDERAAATLAAQAKLLSCDVAVELTQQGQLLHGGWGYAEEYPISRYVVDAQVLPIFEGVKPVLELKVIARSLLAG